MAREVELINLLPNVYKEVEEMQEIMKVENPFINGLWANTEQIYTDSFILTSTNYGLDRRFKFLNMPIVPGEDRDTKVFKLLARYQEQAPYTRRSLKKLLDSLLGEGRYILDIDAANKTLKVRIELTVSGQYDAVIDLLERITPQNMVIIVELRYNTYGQLRTFTHAQLSSYTHKHLREEVL